MFAFILAAAVHSQTPQFDAKAAERFANLALACVHKEYPNKISHSMNSDKDVAPPRELTPAFYGCYDWHSSVHGHWLLVRLLRTFPDASFASAAREALKQSLSANNLKQEAAYLHGQGRASFERPYGLSWLLQLCAELREWNDPLAREWSANLKPLEQIAVVAVQKGDLARDQFELPKPAVACLARGLNCLRQLSLIVVDIAEDKVRRPGAKQGDDFRGADVSAMHDGGYLLAGENADRRARRFQVPVRVADDSQSHGSSRISV